MGFPDSSIGKESAYNGGDPGSIPGAGRSAGEGIGYPLQYSGLEYCLLFNMVSVAVVLTGGVEQFFRVTYLHEGVMSSQPCLPIS